MDCLRKRTYRGVVAQNQTAREASFDGLRAVLKNKPDAGKQREWLTGLGLDELINALRTDQVSAVEALEAYQDKALDVNDRLNCVTVFVAEAKTWAQELDAEWRGVPAKPALFGVPFSVKDNFFMVGYDATCGCAKKVNCPRSEECALVSHLRDLGAVPFCRTNVPQTLLSYVCSNPVWGTTLNPFDQKRSPGGSSGGEAALLAAGGSPFGIGSDVAGSLRIPAAFCGLTTIKPGSTRLKAPGAHPGVPGISRVGLSYGFFTKRVGDLEKLMGLAICPAFFARSPFTAPLPWNQSVARGEDSGSAPLRIGVCLSDGWFEPVPSVRRAVQTAADALADSHPDRVTIVPFAIPDAAELFSHSIRALLPDNGKYVVKEGFGGEDEDKYLAESVRVLKLPTCARPLASRLLKLIWPRFGLVVNSYNRSLTDAREAHAYIDQYKETFLAEWRRAGLDALILPPFPFPAVPHAYPSKLFMAGSYTLMFNVLDIPSGILPVTKVTPEDLIELEGSYPRSDPVYNFTREAMKDSEGLPVGVQVATLPYQEELCARVMGMIEGAVGVGGTK